MEKIEQTVISLLDQNQQKRTFYGISLWLLLGLIVTLMFKFIEYTIVVPFGSEEFSTLITLLFISALWVAFLFVIIFCVSNNKMNHPIVTRFVSGFQITNTVWLLMFCLFVFIIPLMLIPDSILYLILFFIGMFLFVVVVIAQFNDCPSPSFHKHSIYFFIRYHRTKLLIALSICLLIFSFLLVTYHKAKFTTFSITLNLMTATASFIAILICINFLGFCVSFINKQNLLHTLLTDIRTLAISAEEAKKYLDKNILGMPVMDFFQKYFSKTQRNTITFLSIPTEIRKKTDWELAIDVVARTNLLTKYLKANKETLNSSEYKKLEAYRNESSVLCQDIAKAVGLDSSKTVNYKKLVKALNKF